jgi:methionyl-tRNA formyltransferase
MRLIFAGTPAFAATALRAIIDAGQDVVLVLTQPDRPAGRGLRVQHSEVKALAQQAGLRIFQPTTLKTDDALKRLRECDAAAMIVAAYGLILPQPVLDVPRLGCINIHASILPRWRGAAPIQRAILAGDATTGISIMRMDAGLDTGPVLLTNEIAITPEDNARTLHDKLAESGARSIVRCLAALESGELREQAQAELGVTYAAKVQKSEAVIDWNQSAQQIDRQIRAFNPAPVAATTLRGEALKIWRAQLLGESTGPAGRILDVSRDGIVVACGRGALRLLEIQRASSRRLSAAEFLLGTSLGRDDKLGT